MEPVARERFPYAIYTYIRYDRFERAKLINRYGLSLYIIVHYTVYFQYFERKRETEKIRVCSILAINFNYRYSCRGKYRRRDHHHHGWFTTRNPSTDLIIRFCFTVGSRPYTYVFLHFFFYSSTCQLLFFPLADVIFFLHEPPSSCGLSHRSVLRRHRNDSQHSISAKRTNRSDRFITRGYAAASSTVSSAGPPVTFDKAITAVPVDFLDAKNRVFSVGVREHVKFLVSVCVRRRIPGAQLEHVSRARTLARGPDTVLP